MIDINVHNPHSKMSLENDKFKTKKNLFKDVCNDKEAPWTQTTFHCKPGFGTVKMPTKTP